MTIAAIRTTIPDRRPSENIRVRWQTDHAAHDFHVTAGFDPSTGAMVEVFYSDGMKSGTDLRNMASDACVLISLLLQHGATVQSIGKSLSAAPVMGQDRPASLIGAVVAALTSPT